MVSVAEAIARSLGRYVRTARGWLICCPVHEDRTPSCSITDGDDGRLLVYCFAGCNPHDILQALYHKGLYGDSSDTLQARPHPQQKSRILQEWSHHAECIWRKTMPLMGSPAEAYLINRGCYVADCEDLRFLPAGAL